MTGLPFVFAAWVSNRPLPEDFKNGFNKAVEAGLGAKAEIAAAHPFPYYDLERYFNQDISYNLDASKLKAMELFLSKIGNSIRIS
jgi:chorismate dehydratase